MVPLRRAPGPRPQSPNTLNAPAQPPSQTAIRKVGTLPVTSCCPDVLPRFFSPVHIGVSPVPARNTHESRLTRTTFRGMCLQALPLQVCGVHAGLAFPTRPGAFSSNRLTGRRHQDVQDAPVEPALLCDVPGFVTVPRADFQSVASDACSPAAPTESGAAGLVCPLPLRRVQSGLRLPRPVHLAPGSQLDPQTTRTHDVGRSPSALPSGVAPD